MTPIIPLRGFDHRFKPLGVNSHPRWYLVQSRVAERVLQALVRVVSWNDQNSHDKDALTAMKLTRWRSDSRSFGSRGHPAI